jgi:hypothetical protein
MPNQPGVSLENNFTKGLLTEFTGLNFPENAATSTENCVYTLVGDVIRRQGFDYEANFTQNMVSNTFVAINTYKWNNASGDGLTQFVVLQVGATLYFYKSSSATVNNPLSQQILTSTINLQAYTASGGAFDTTQECQFADGNGYLFVYQPTMDPIYVTYTSPSTITATLITVQVRDFNGVVDGLTVTTRPSTDSNPHLYNLVNQGWTAQAPWAAASSTAIPVGSFTALSGSTAFTVASGISGINNGDIVSCTVYYAYVPSPGFYPDGIGTFAGTVTSYSGTTLTINISQASLSIQQGIPLTSFYWSQVTPYGIAPTNVGFISTWFSGIGNYPSNADVWWYFKNSSDVYSPSTTYTNVNLNSGYAPRGHYVLNVFQQQRSAISGISGLSDVITSARPRTGTWFQGRVWYAGVDASVAAGTTNNAFSWSEQIYFSQIITDPSQFGNCYQTNDPTSETLFGLLPTDGGVIQIQGCGSIYKLVPLMNALLVFAANGVWYITGSTGIGFTADDFNIIQLSKVRSISGTSYVDVNGIPMFWNEEGIYVVAPAAQGQSVIGQPLHVSPWEVTPLTVGTIQSYYDAIPTQSKKFVRGVYDPINYVVQWVFKSTNEINVQDRYTYDSILCYNVYNKAFYPYSFNTSGNVPTISGVVYVQSPGGTGAPDSIIKYVTLNSVNTGYTFAEERDPTYTDWVSSGDGQNFTSSFTTGYKLHGQGQRRFQMPYIYVYSRMEQPTVAYYIQSIWDYASVPDSNRWSIPQYTSINTDKFSMVQRRHRLRGRGVALQIQVTSVTGLPFDIMGWSAYEAQNTGP